MDSAAAILLLSEIPGVGEKTLGGALRGIALRRMEPQAIFTLEERALCDLGFPERSAKAIREITPEMRAAALATARSLRAAGIHVLTQSDAAYPKRLLERLDEPPPVLFAYGATDLLCGSTFAVANSNGAPETALAATESAAEKLVQAGWRPVTGHNRPAYQRTALAALRFGGRVCYVLDRGLLEAFGDDLRRELFSAAHVWSRAYDPAVTLTLTPFPLRAHSIAVHNRRRDELVFSLADLVLVGEIRPGGQMERCVLAALERGAMVSLLGEERPNHETLLTAGALRGLPGEGAVHPAKPPPRSSS